MDNNALPTWTTLPLWRLGKNLQRIYRQPLAPAAAHAAIHAACQRASPWLLRQDALHQQMPPDSSGHGVAVIDAPAGWQMAVHTLAQGKCIPPHAHPGMASIILVMEGEIMLKQFPPAAATHLQAGELGVGLPHFLNAHAITSTSPVARFLSLRLPLSRTKPRKRLVCWLAFTFMPLPCLAFPLLACTDPPDNPLASAHQLRTQAHTEQDYQAAIRLYLAAAERGEAEAQYWLSVMYLHGQGVAINRPAAREWARQSANQGYPPAQALYADILNGLYDEMTGC